MRRLLLLSLLILCFGCSQNYFNVPKQSFADKVKVLGVAPIMIDADSDIRFPQKEQLITLVSEQNRKYEQQFVRMLKETGNFYTVALLDGDPQRIINNLLFRREKRDDATILYNKYFWKSGELRDYIRKNNLDAVMLITVSGISQNEKIFSGNLLTSMTGDFNYLIMTAQIMDADGTVLWEYPNFRSRILKYHPMINLQYPDFSEAEANLSPTVSVKFKTLDGIRLTLEQKRKDILLRETQESAVYGKQFDEIISYIKYEPDEIEKKETKAPAEGIKPRPEEKPAPTVKETPVKQEIQSPAAPVAEPPKAAAPEITRVPMLETPRETIQSAPVVVPAE